MDGLADLAEYRERSYELWQRMASSWERGRAVLWEATRPVSEWLVDQLAPQPGQTVLELAAGAGESGFLAAARLGDQGRLIFSDFAPQMVESATRVAAELGVTNAEFRVLDAVRLELDDASVDDVICPLRLHADGRAQPGPAREPASAPRRRPSRLLCLRRAAAQPLDDGRAAGDGRARTPSAAGPGRTGAIQPQASRPH